jgi:hypothetical protein
MKVLTKYPIVINNKRVSPKDYYLNAEASVDICPITGLPRPMCGRGMGYRRRFGQQPSYRKTTTVVIPSVLFGI